MNVQTTTGLSGLAAYEPGTSRSFINPEIRAEALKRYATVQPEDRTHGCPYYGGCPSCHDRGIVCHCYPTLTDMEIMMLNANETDTNDGPEYLVDEDLHDPAVQQAIIEDLTVKRIKRDAAASADAGQIDLGIPLETTDNPDTPALLMDTAPKSDDGQRAFPGMFMEQTGLTGLLDDTPGGSGSLL